MQTAQLKSQTMLKKFSQFINEKQGGTKQIFCDLDGVLVDFNRGFKNIDANEDKLTPDKYNDKHGKHSMWKIVDPEGESFWARLKWMKDGRSLWDYLSRYEPIILSSPSRSKHSIPGKMEWIKRNLGITQAKPTTSAVRKVADLALPITGPVNLSISVIVKSYFLTLLKSSIMEKVPTLLAIKAGVSLANTAVLPKNFPA